MADMSVDPKAVGVWGLRKVLAADVDDEGERRKIEETIKAVFAPRVGGEGNIRTVLVQLDKNQLPFAKVFFVDEPSASAALALNGESVPELSDEELRVQLLKKTSRERPQIDPKKLAADVAAKLSGDTNFLAKIAGKPGKDGMPGKKGDKGDAGPQGPAGPKGDKGDAGPQGPHGYQGRGKPAPKAAWVLNVLLSLTALVVVLGYAFCGSNGQGPRGERGFQGNPGIDGKDGAPGEAPSAAEVADTLKSDPEFIRAVTPATAVAPEPEAESEEPAPETEPLPEPTAEEVAETPPGVTVVEGGNLIRYRLEEVAARFRRDDQRLDALEAARR